MTAAGGLEVATALDLSTFKAREGDLATIVFTIRNNSPNYVILRDLTYLADPALKETASAAATWQFAQEGKLTFIREGNEWKFEKARARRPEDPPEPRPVTAPLFNTGLLAPSESITVRTRVRLLHFPKYFQLLYFELPFEKVQMDVYFEVRQNRDLRYRIQIGDELRARLVADPKTEVKGHRTVLYPFAERVEPSARIKPLKVEADLQPRDFSLRDALRKSGGASADQFTYWAGQDAWILKRGAEFSAVTPIAVTPLPLLRQMDRTFYFIDNLANERIEIELQDDAVASVMQLEKKYKVVALKSPGQPKRFFIFLSSPDLPKFFADVRSSSMAIDVEMTPEGGGRLRVVR